MPPGSGLVTSASVRLIRNVYSAVSSALTMTSSAPLAARTSPWRAGMPALRSPSSVRSPSAPEVGGDVGRSPAADRPAGDRRQTREVAVLVGGQDDDRVVHEAEAFRPLRGRSSRSTGAVRSIGEQRHELLDQDAEKLAKRAGVPAEPDPVVLVHGAGEVRDDELAAGRDECLEPAAHVARARHGASAR